MQGTDESNIFSKLFNKLGELYKMEYKEQTIKSR